MTPGFWNQLLPVYFPVESHSILIHCSHNAFHASIGILLGFGASLLWLLRNALNTCILFYNDVERTKRTTNEFLFLFLLFPSSLYTDFSALIYFTELSFVALFQLLINLCSSVPHRFSCSPWTFTKVSLKCGLYSLYSSSSTGRYSKPNPALVASPYLYPPLISLFPHCSSNISIYSPTIRPFTSYHLPFLSLAVSNKDFFSSPLHLKWVA